MGAQSSTCSEQSRIAICDAANIPIDVIVSIIKTTPTIYRDVIFLSRNISRAATIAVASAEMYYAPTWAYMLKLHPTSLKLFATEIGQYTKLNYRNMIGGMHSRVITIMTKYEANVVTSINDHREYAYRTPHRWIYDTYNLDWTDDCTNMMSQGVDSTASCPQATIQLWCKYYYGNDPSLEIIHANPEVCNTIDIKDVDIRTAGVCVNACNMNGSFVAMFKDARMNILNMCDMIPTNIYCNFTESRSNCNTSIEDILKVLSPIQLEDAFTAYPHVFSVKYLVKIWRKSPHFRDKFASLNWFIIALREPWMIARTPELPWDIAENVVQMLAYHVKHNMDTVRCDNDWKKFIRDDSWCEDTNDTILDTNDAFNLRDCVTTNCTKKLLAHRYTRDRHVYGSTNITPLWPR